MLEFQGEIVGECEGKELGLLEIKEVSNLLLFVNSQAHCGHFIRILGW